MGALILFLAIIPTILFEGWILTYLWKWFVVPQFGLDPLHFTVAAGLSLLYNYMSMDLTTTRESFSDDTLTALAFTIFRVVLGFFVLFVGYIIHLFLP